MMHCLLELPSESGKQLLFTFYWPRQVAVVWPTERGQNHPILTMCAKREHEYFRTALKAFTLEQKRELMIKKASSGTQGTFLSHASCLSSKARRF